MDTTIKNLKIGDRLVFGKYGVRNDYPERLVWMKASPNCDFITKYIPDYLIFDAAEPKNKNQNIRYNGNNNYALSNIYSFLNSDEENWFYPTHDCDAPPDNRATRPEYKSHYGFLFNFEEYEINSIVPNYIEIGGRQVQSLVRLPLTSEIIGADRLKLFIKHGIRPKGTGDMIRGRRSGFNYNSYIDYWVLGDEPAKRNLYNVKVISRNGGLESAAPCAGCGIRPVCKLSPDTPLVLGEDGMHYIKPYTVQHDICTENELISFLGIAQP